MKTNMFLLVIGFLSIISMVNAQENIAPQTNFEILADVNIYDTKITSQDKNIFKISFDLNNSGEVQSGIKYGIILLNKETKVIWDEKAYPEIITLNKDETQKKEIIYEAPVFLSGEYQLIVVSRNENGFQFSQGMGGAVKLEGSSKYIKLDSEKCFLNLDGKAEDRKYSLRQAVNINKDETLNLTCSLGDVSFFGDKVNFKVQSYNRTIFGELIEEGKGVASLENNQISITIPRVIKPQTYDALITLHDEGGNAISNSLNVHYTLRGPSVTIQNATLDKAAYQKGESPKLTISWIGSADYLPSSNPNQKKDENLKLIVSILGDKGENKNLEKVLEYSTQGKKNEIVLNSLDAEINSIKVAITDNKNNILDETIIPLKTNQELISEKLPIKWPVIIIIIILSALLVILVKKISFKGIKILIFFFSFCLIGLGVSEEAKGAWWSMTGESANADGTTNLNKGVYSPGETIYYTLHVDSAHCVACGDDYCSGCDSAMENGLVMWTAVNLGDSSSTPEVVFTSPKNPVNYTQSGDSTTVTFTAPNTPGTYYIQKSFVDFRNFVRIIFPHPTNIGSYYGRLKLCGTNFLTDPFCFIGGGFFRVFMAPTTSYTVAGALPIDGSCGIAQGSYSATDTTYRSPFCSAGTVMSTPAFPSPGTNRTWVCLGSGGGINVSCSASRAAAPINGVCGSGNMTYPSTTVAWPVGTTFCSSGTSSPVAPTFPASGATTAWQCLGSGGGSTSSCAAISTSAPVNGSCGTRNTTYPSTTSAWPIGSTLCSAGTASPDPVIFPVAGATASWQCLGSGGGSDTSCLTTHQAAAIPTPILNFSASPTTVNSGDASTLTWTTANVASCWASGDWTGWKSSSGGNEVQLNITANKTYNMECWNSSGGTTGVIPAFVVANIPIDGSCGTRNTTYPSTTSAWPVGSTLCSAGTASPVSVTFPATGSTESWQCLGSGGGSDTSCLTTHQAAAIPTPILNFSASPTTVNSGDSSTLTWTTADVASCWASGDWDGGDGWKNSSGGNEVQLNITANKTYNMECWNLSGGTTGVIPAFVTVNAPIDGACGTKATTFPSSDSDWPGGLTLCSAGIASPDPVMFPADGSSEVWNCNSINGGIPANCTATSLSSAVNGVCGTKNTNYPIATATWPGGDTLCSSGTANPNNPPFPNVNSTTNWQCEGSSGGVDSSCTASRMNNPVGIEFQEVSP